MSIISAGSSSPWSVPGSWDSITIGGVTYGVNSPPTTTIQTQEIAVGLTVQNVPTSQFQPVGGKVVIKGAERFYKNDVKDAQGSDGWTITYRGLRPKPFDIEFYVWTPAQYDYFTNSVMPAILYSGVKKQVQALQVSHPALAVLQITQVFVNKIGVLERIGDDGMYRSVVNVSEYLNPPPLNVTTTPVGAKNTNAATSPGVQPPTAVNQRLNIIANLKAQVAAGGAIPSGFSGPL